MRGINSPRRGHHNFFLHARLIVEMCTAHVPPGGLLHVQDIVSCLVSGLLTIGPRFGGAIDDAARYFKDAHDRSVSGLEPYSSVPRLIQCYAAHFPACASSIRSSSKHLSG
jgi:hypothetical protein